MSLRPEDRVLLDLLCQAAPMAAELDRAFRLRSSWGASIDRLRFKGLVDMATLRPSPSALADFMARRRPAERPIEIDGDDGPLDAGDRELRAPPARGTGRRAGHAAGEGPVVPALPDSASLDREQGAFKSRAAKSAKWSEDEDERLRQAYANGERIDLVAEELGRTEKAARTRAHKVLGLGGTHAAGRGGWATDPDWTEAEDQRLREAYGKIRMTKLAAELGRSTRSIYSRAFVLGLSKNRAWSADEANALAIAHRRGLALVDVAAALGRKYYAVAKYSGNHGFSFQGPGGGKRARLVEPIDLAGLLALADPEVPLPPTRHAAPKPPAGPRPRGWSPEPRGWACPKRQAAFVAGLRRTGTCLGALQAIGLGRNSATLLRNARDRFPDFDRRCEAALREYQAEKLARRTLERHRAEASARAEARAASPPPPPPPARPQHRPGRLSAQSGFGFGSGPEGLPPVRRYKSDAEIAAENLAYLEERRRTEALAGGQGRLLSVDEAKSILQRGGYSVCRADVVGGDPDRWAVGSNKAVTDQELVDRARRIQERQRA